MEKQDDQSSTGLQSLVVQTEVQWQDIKDEYGNAVIRDLGFQSTADATNGLLQNLRSFYSENPTIVQLQSLAYTMDNNYYKDNKQIFFVKAPGGSGKTLCFTLPAVQLVAEEFRRDLLHKTCNQVKIIEKVNGQPVEHNYIEYAPRIVIMASNKLLCEQIKSEIETLLPDDVKDSNKVRVSIVYHAQELTDYGQILVGVSGRIKSLASTNNNKGPFRITFKYAQIIAIDETEQAFKNNESAIKEIFDEQIGPLSNGIIICTSATLTLDVMRAVEDYTYRKTPSLRRNVISIELDLRLDGVEQYSIQLKQQQAGNKKYAKEASRTLLQDLLTHLSQDLSIKTQGQIIVFFSSSDEIEDAISSLSMHYWLDDKRGEFDRIHSKLVKLQHWRTLKIDYVKDTIARLEKELLASNFRQNMREELVRRIEEKLKYKEYVAIKINLQEQARINNLPIDQNQLENNVALELQKIPEQQFKNKVDEEIERILEDEYLRELDKRVNLTINSDLKNNKLPKQLVQQIVHEQGELQNQLQKDVWQRFRNGAFRILFATDMIARGIDIKKSHQSQMSLRHEQILLTPNH